MTGSKHDNSSGVRNHGASIEKAKRPLPAPVPARTNPFGLRAAPKSLANALDPNARATAAVAESNDATSSAADPYYRIVASAPAFDPREIDAELRAVEVRVCWGARDVLQVMHLAPPRPFVVGESDAAAGIAADFELGSSFLGCDRMAIAQPNGATVVVNVPAGARLSVRNANGLREHDDLTTALRVSADVPGALAYSLGEGETALLAWKGFVYEIRGVAAAKPIARRSRLDRSPFVVVGIVGALVAGAFGITSLLMPPDSMLGGETLRLDDRYVAALVEAREQAQEQATAQSAEASSSAAGQAARGDTGEAGDPSRRDRGHRMANAGERDPSEATIARDSSATDAARHNVVVDAVATIATFFGQGPSSEFGSDTPVGADAMTAIGNLIGGPVGTSGGLGGLGLVGSGLGSGGTGLGTYGTGDLSRAIGTGPGGGHDGTYGRCSGANCDINPDRAAVIPRVPVPNHVDVAGGLTADAIRRVITRNIAQVRHCYEQGLQADPSLDGRVSVAFVVGPTGAVIGARTVGGNLAESGVGTCVAQSVRRWSFPQPDGGGTVSVQFPFVFSRAQ